MLFEKNKKIAILSLITRICNYFQKIHAKNHRQIPENKIISKKTPMLSKSCKKCYGILRPIKGKNDFEFPPGSSQCRNCGRINIPK